MPRLKKTDAQRRAERFREHYRVGKARLQLHEPDIASAIGMAESTLRKYKRSPDMFSIGQLVRLGRVFGWTEAEYMEIIEGRRIGPCTNALTTYSQP